jgi:hypothetical protein
MDRRELGPATITRSNGASLTFDRAERLHVQFLSSEDAPLLST